MVLGSHLREARATKMRRPPDGLENSENRRSAGRHGNQHVRLRRAQISASRRPDGPKDCASRPALGPWPFGGSSNLFGIKEIKVCTAIREFGEIACRGFAFGGPKGGFDGVERVKL